MYSRSRLFPGSPRKNQERQLSEQPIEEYNQKYEQVVAEVDLGESILTKNVFIISMRGGSLGRVYPEGAKMEKVQQPNKGVSAEVVAL